MPIKMEPDTLLIIQRPRRLNFDRKKFTNEVRVNHQSEAPSITANSPTNVSGMEVHDSTKLNFANMAMNKKIMSGLVIVKAKAVIKS